jgi:hypothetical protein
MADDNTCDSYVEMLVKQADMFLERSTRALDMFLHNRERCKDCVTRLKIAIKDPENFKRGHCDGGPNSYPPECETCRRNTMTDEERVKFIRRMD